MEEPVAEQVTLSEYPNLAELGRRARESGYSVDREFAYGLDLILDALERAVSPAGGVIPLPHPHRTGMPLLTRTLRAS